MLLNQLPDDSVPHTSTWLWGATFVSQDISSSLRRPENVPGGPEKIDLVTSRRDEEVIVRIL